MLGSVLLFQLLTQVLEFALVSAMAAEPITDEASYFAARNRPAVLAARVGYTAVAALLSGYMAAKIVEAYEMRHAMVAAGLVTALLISEFTVSEYARFTPVWMRALLILLAGPVMLAGAWVRATAAKADPPPIPPAADEGVQS